MIDHRHWLPLGALALTASLYTAIAPAAPDEALVDRRTPLVIDFIDGAYLPKAGGIVVTGSHGLLGLLKVSDTGAEFTRYAGIPAEDFTALEKLSDSEVLLGSSSGKVFLFDGTKATEVAALSEFHEPVLDIAVANGQAWAVGGRGLLATSNDGKTWTKVTIEKVTQPVVTIPGTAPGEWYFGVSKIGRAHV